MSAKFERVKRDHPGLAFRLDALQSYIQHQLAAGETFIIPKLAGAAMQLSNAEAFVVLEILTRAGIMREVYNVYCRPQNILLATVEDVKRLDDIPHCDFCDEDHDSSSLYVEIAFRVEDQSHLREAA